MKWVITQDHMDGGRAVGIGTYRGDPAALPYRFRLKDGDGEVYYEGKSDDDASGAAFQPLDMWAEATRDASKFNTSTARRGRRFRVWSIGARFLLTCIDSPLCQAAQ
jgi:hypothetical protein